MSIGMVTDVEEIILRLQTLSPKELEVVHGHIKVLKQTQIESSDKKVNGDADEDIVINVICSVLQAKGIGHPVGFVRKSRSDRRDKLHFAASFVKNVVGTRIEQEALLTTVIDLLSQDIARLKIPLTGTVILNNLHRIPGVVDKHFPGYAKAGLLKLILRRNSE